MPQKKVFTGFIDDCSPQQLQTLDKFRERVKAMGCTDPQYDDIYLLRFLRARKFDLEKTTDMWKNMINWRKEKNVDAIMEKDFPELNEAKQYYPHFWYRTDKQGRPMFIERPGKVQLDKLNKVITQERMEQHYIQDSERLLKQIFPACSKAKGELINSTCYIMDLKGASAKMMSPKIWDFVKSSSKIGQDYYPETLGTMYIVNTPLFFHGAWQIIKGFLDEKTRKKIHILGSNFKKELLQCVDENDLPDFLGGKLTEEDYGAHLTIEQGPWVKSDSGVPTSAGASDNNPMYLSTELRDMKDGLDDTEFEEKSANGLHYLPKDYKSLEEIEEGDFDETFDELPSRQFVNMTKPRRSVLSTRAFI